MTFRFVLNFTDVLDDRVACDRVEGSEKRVPLIENGENIELSDENKIDYLNRVIKWRLVTSLQLQTRAAFEDFTNWTRKTMDRLAISCQIQDFSNC